MYESDMLAKRIKQFAKSKDIQLKDMLTSLGLNKNTFTGMYNGSMLKSDSLARIADYLDCSVDYLLGRTDCESVNHPTADSVSLDPQADRMMEAFLQLDADNRDIILGKVKELLKEQRYEEENGELRVAK